MPSCEVANNDCYLYAHSVIKYRTSETTVKKLPRVQNNEQFMI